MIPDASSATLIPIINRMIRPDSIVYTDTWASYNALDISDFHHLRINHSKLFADRDNHINGIENFWNQAKRQRKFNGVPKHQSVPQRVRMAFDVRQLKKWVMANNLGQPLIFICVRHQNKWD